jgi:hypothetical protein
LRADPNSISDHTPTIKSALDNRLLTDENAVSDLECLGMNNRHVLSYVCARAKPLDQRPKADSAHDHVDRVCPVAVI